LHRPRRKPPEPVPQHRDRGPGPLCRRGHCVERQPVLPTAPTLDNEHDSRRQCLTRSHGRSIPKSARAAMAGGSLAHPRVHPLTVPPASPPSQPPARLRDLAALLLSVLLHLLPVILGLIPALALRLLPKPPIEMEILPPKPKP